MKKKGVVLLLLGRLVVHFQPEEEEEERATRARGMMMDLVQECVEREDTQWGVCRKKHWGLSLQKTEGST